MFNLRPRLLLADDHPILLAALRMILETEFDVVGTATDGRALLEAAEQLRPDLVVADISMPTVDGIEATRRLQATSPGVKVLILSVHDELCCVRSAFAAGARGYLTKTSAPKEIERAVREVLADRFYVSPEVARAALDPQMRAESGLGSTPAWSRDNPSPTANDALTARERKILHLLSEGLCNKEIAECLGVAVTTVRTHLRSLYQKLSLESRVELALYAAQAHSAT